MARHKSQWETFLDAITVLVAFCALGLMGYSFVSRLDGNTGPTSLEPKKIADWKDYSTEGRRMGPSDPAVTIVEFGDYECPACRVFEKLLWQVRVENPEDVAIVYRHLPLTYHRFAYPAARAAECAAVQGNFEAFHRLLFTSSDWLSDPNPRESFLAFAREVGVLNLDEFKSCVEQVGLVDSIERDISAAKELGVRGTPGVLINEDLFFSTMDSVGIREVVSGILRRAERG
jgi:protein-disulfide isomerase